MILLYLESIKDARRFARLAPTVARDTPIVVVKSGRSTAGARAAASHTGSLLASSDVSVDALFRQSGVIRTATLEEMFDVATFLANQPPPKGNRVGIVTNAGGLGILCADTCEAEGLEVPPLNERTVASLSAFLPPEASAANPVDMVAVIVLYIPPLESDAPDVARGIVEAATEVDGAVPILTTFMSTRGLPEQLHSPAVRLPSYTFPEQAAIALARVCAYGTWRMKDHGGVPTFADVRIDEAAGIIALERGDGWLEQLEIEQLLACYGISTVTSTVVATADETADAARRVGGPVAIKAIGAELIHKTEAGAVAVDVAPGEAAERARAMSDRIRAQGIEPTGYLVQRMVPDGIEMFVGMTLDPTFGPVVAVGAGGTAVELMKDIAVRITPMTDLDAAEMLRELMTFPLLDGYRGATRMDIAALEDALLRVSALVEDQLGIAELDLNPLMAPPPWSRRRRRADPRHDAARPTGVADPQPRVSATFKAPVSPARANVSYASRKRSNSNRCVTNPPTSSWPVRMSSSNVGVE